MEEIHLKVVTLTGIFLIDINIPINSLINHFYYKLYKYFLHCCFDLLYDNKIISPLDKITDIISKDEITPKVIIFNVISYEKIKFFISNIDSCISINTAGKIIDWNTCDSYYYINNLNNFNFIKNYINLNYNCLNIINICSTECYVALLFENGIAIILSYEDKIIINTFNNVTQIVKTNKEIGILINNNKFIVCNYFGEIFENDKLSNLNCNYIYANYYLFFIVCQEYIIIVRNHLFFPDQNDRQLITFYYVNNIFQIYDTWDSSIIAAIKEDNTLVSFDIVSDNELNITPFEDINDLSLKIKKILSVDLSFIALTYDDSIVIWGDNLELLDIYQFIKNDLINVQDIIVSRFCIGILKKNNTIIVISINGTYSIYNDYNYIQIISTKYEIFGLADNNNVYCIQIQEPNYCGLHIESLTNIKEFYATMTSILVISHDNIIQAYSPIYSYMHNQTHFYKNSKYDTNIPIFYRQQILDLKSVRTDNNTFFIIRQNDEIIKIQGDRSQEHKTLNDISKFMNF